VDSQGIEQKVSGIIRSVGAPFTEHHLDREYVPAVPSRV
jgi:hypothetical protein